jgi:hypothetical protein
MNMAITGGIADWARGEIPQDWDALQEKYGDPFMQRKIDTIVAKLFNEPLDTAGQDTLDVRVLDYAGKLVALELINPAISYWSKQAISVGARGQNENKSYKDRAQDLLELRKQLLGATRGMEAEIWPLIPLRRVDRTPVGPRVRQVVGAVTSDPDDFERPFLPAETSATEGTGTL